MNAVTPLHIDPEVEGDARFGSLFGRVWRSVGPLLPIRLYYEIPVGRRSVEVQLHSRDGFSNIAWSQTHLPAERVLPILKVLKDELNLPNHFLVPDDPLFLVLTGDYDDLPIESVRMGLRERLGVNVRQDDLIRMYEEGNWTVGMFVAFVVQLLPDVPR
jgi:hypothetical protein